MPSIVGHYTSDQYWGENGLQLTQQTLCLRFAWAVLLLFLCHTPVWFLSVFEFPEISWTLSASCTKGNVIWLVTSYKKGKGKGVGDRNSRIFVIQWIFVNASVFPLERSIYPKISCPGLHYRLPQADQNAVKQE